MFLLALIPPQMIGKLSKLHPKELKFTSISGGIKVNFSSPSGLTVKYYRVRKEKNLKCSNLISIDK